MSTNQKDFFWGAFVGATLATLSTLLFTTKKGKQIQDNISTACEDVGKNIKDSFSKVKDDIEDKAENAKDSAEQLAKKTTNKIKQET